MTVGDVCNRRIPTAAGTMTVHAAAKSMRTFDEPLLVVIDERDGKRFAVGIVTERDFVAVVAHERDPRQLTLEDIMRPHPGFVTESDGIFDTVCWMRRNRLREVVVNSQTGTVLGIVGFDQLVESLADEIGEAVSSAPEERTMQGRNALH